MEEMWTGLTQLTYATVDIHNPLYSSAMFIWITSTRLGILHPQCFTVTVDPSAINLRDSAAQVYFLFPISSCLVRFYVSTDS